MTAEAFIHPDAVVEDGATVAVDSKIWGMAVVRTGARVGAGVTVGRNAYIDAGVIVGDGCKIQNNALIYAPARLDDGVFIGPAAVLANDVYPRAINADGTPKALEDWVADGVHVGYGASVGAGAVVVAGVRIGRWACVAAGAVVAADVPDHALVAGVPARRIGWVGFAGRQLQQVDPEHWRCPVDGAVFIASRTGLQPFTR